MLNMCWYCGSPVTDPDPIGRSLRCQKCGKDLRVCKNCRFFLTGASGGSGGSCRESNAEPQADRERGNFCDWFSLDPKRRGENAQKEGAAAFSNEKNRADAARTALDSLFK